MLAPVHIHWCIIYWTRGNPREELGSAQADSEVGRDVLDWMVREELIVWSHEEQRHVPQERLGVFVDHLCKQPLPEHKWVMPGTPQ